ncbi:MAG: CPBP family intramembrane metalloprotease [Tissierellia bacterium]|nr:CPBP family intramembrane metalloprotease [Tissierellia bacterium]
MREKTNYPSILEINIFYMIIAFLLISLGAKAQARELYTGLLITEYIIILLPSLLYLKLKGYYIKETLKLNSVDFKEIIISILLILFSYPVAVFFNYIGFVFLHYFGEIKPNPVPIPSNTRELLTGFLIIALSPGICEEIMFRGLVLNAYKSLGNKKAIIYSAILFGIFHFNAQNLLGPIYLGIILGIIYIKTNSIYPSIIGHTTNNTIALALGTYFNLKGGNPDLNIEEINMIGTGELFIALFSLALVALIFGILSYKLIKLLDNKNEDLDEIDDFISEELIDKLDERNNLHILETLPLLVVLVVFIRLNYLFFFQ